MLYRVIYSDNKHSLWYADRELVENLASVFGGKIEKKVLTF